MSGRHRVEKHTQKTQKPIYKRLWFWALIVVIVVAVGSLLPQTDRDSLEQESQESMWNAAESLYGMSVEAAWDEIETQGFTLGGIETIAGTDLNSDENVRHSSSAKSWIVVGAEQDNGEKTVAITVTSPDEFNKEHSTEKAKIEPDVPAEYGSALAQAKSYSSILHMSKQGVYDQLVSEYGGQFAPEAAQYAIDNLQADYNANALAKAGDYSNTMHMSKRGIYDQLTSEYGEKFTAEEAQYAIDNLQADYNANALAKARDYQETMNMSPEAIRDQLVSDYGEKFTQEEADYAVANL